MTPGSSTSTPTTCGLFPGPAQFHRPSHRLAAPAQAADRRDRRPVTLCRPAEPGEAHRHKEPGGREGPSRFRACLSRAHQGLAVRACARHLCADRADGAAHPRRLCLFVGGLVMWQTGWTGSVRPPTAERQASRQLPARPFGGAAGARDRRRRGLGLLSLQRHAVPDAGAAGERSWRDREVQRLPHPERRAAN